MIGNRIRVVGGLVRGFFSGCSMVGFIGLSACRLRYGGLRCPGVWGFCFEVLVRSVVEASKCILT